MNKIRLEKTLEQFNQIGAASGKGITRLAYTPEHAEANRYFIELCKQEGMNVRIDACGNVIARRQGAEPELPAVACGSHLDTVQQGGRYDGTVGVVAALEVVRSLNDRQVVTRHPLEIISFACEESARFGVSTIGSKAMTGKWVKAEAEGWKDKNGISFREALETCSLSMEKVESARRQPEELKAFFELHIEQGPLLENKQKDIGIAIAISAPTRLEVTVQGKASHSGTTPMMLRKDALLGAAEIIAGVERAALSEADRGTVATVGVCEVSPGAMNVVPESVQLLIDIRGTVIESKRAVVQQLSALFGSIRDRRGLEIASRVISEEMPVLLAEETAASLADHCRRLELSYLYMNSGAGHDAMNMADFCPTGLIFIPSTNGLSHHPEEYTSIEHIAKGTQLLEEALIEWAVPCGSEQQCPQRWERIS
ncbi:Zn-dependent hydrolase [Paenibacillus senegalensis]|uniref:Zn-dependent hydrolase n=1 Tax=Paenibacillus senegalensis TaxID=1465766 RepID=UPI000288772C|nr:Zn-dependent hydrolase [Paenibacillus senegalensis]